MLPSSHKTEDPPVKQFIPPGRVIQYSIDETEVAKYQPLQLAVKRGDAILFDGNLIHRSGNNTSDRVRFSAVAMYHQLLSSNASIPMPRFTYRDLTPQEWFQENN